MKKIHACPNDCILFWKEHKNEDTCPKCGASRYKERVCLNLKKKVSCKVVSPLVLAKVLRYFHEWFEDRVRNLDVSEDVKWLSEGPNRIARRFSTYAINGYKFVIESCERKTQNSGIMVVSSTIKFRSKKDENPLVENVTYYGVSKDIIELDYYGHFKFVLFKCHWFQIKQDGFGLVLINFRRLIYENDPFVFASQVKQVYYTKDPNDDWHVVTNTTPRDLFHIYGDLENKDVEKHLDDTSLHP